MTCTTWTILLVLDNCEHLLEACAGLVEVLLHRCAGLEIVATSREPLGVKGEGTSPSPRSPYPTPVASNRLKTSLSMRP